MIKPYYEEDGITLYHADCRDVLPRLDAVGFCWTDPPYNGGDFFASVSTFFVDSARQFLYTPSCQRQSRRDESQGGNLTGSGPADGAQQMANTTPINECSIGADAEYTVKVATARGWSDFAIYPNGTLEGVNPDGQRDIVPDFAKMAKDAAPELLAALEAGYSDLRTRLIEHAQVAFLMPADEAAQYVDKAWPVLEQMRAAIAKAKGEA